MARIMFQKIWLRILNYDLEDGDVDLVQEDLNGDDEKKGIVKRKRKQVAEEQNSDDELCDFSDSDDEEKKFNFQHFSKSELEAKLIHLGNFSHRFFCLKRLLGSICKERL